jgi:broad specificity phosphatase PhoE
VSARNVGAVPIYVVRHAHAGHRRDWDGPDDSQRPLTDKGWKQAAKIAKRLGDAGVSEIWSSPFTRCVESVEPLAERCDLSIGRTDALAEGSVLVDTVDLAEKLAATDTTAVLCSHGDVIPDLLGALARRGTYLDPKGACPKGSIWVLQVEDGKVARADYEGMPR